MSAGIVTVIARYPKQALLCTVGVVSFTALYTVAAVGFLHLMSAIPPSMSARQIRDRETVRILIQEREKRLDTSSGIPLWQTRLIRWGHETRKQAKREEQPVS